MTLTSLLIQVQRWLMQPRVWRFVGFSSTVVALLCYALSSSFNHLFGDWNLLKICVYSVLSFIFCFAVLFAKEWQPSNSIRFKAHTAFLVLTVTSVYSFFYDKMVNEKSDAYSLISCAAFAVMSLSLSRQTHFGFELDLLYFFLGALMVQLMKIKLLLGIVGACFGYSLIVLRSSLNAPLDSGYHEIQDQHPVTVPIDIAVIMPKLKACMEAFMKNKQEVIIMLSMHMGEYMKVYDEPNNKDHIPTDNNLVIDALQSDIVNDLSDVMKLMVAAGYEKECCHVYSSCRREFLEQVLIELSLLQFDVEDVVTDTHFIACHIQIWIKAFSIARRILFPNERRLCERVFSGFTSATDLAFMDVCRELMIHLLDFANSFAARSSLPLLWPKIPEVLDTLHGLIPELQSLFFELPNDSLTNEAINICKRLEKATKGIFMEFENWICHNTAKADFSGWLYPITRNVMNSLVGVSEARILLEKVFQENSLAADRGETSFSVFMQTSKIMELLDRHLEVKSKSYHDPDLHHFSMMNNRWYIGQRVKRSHELRKILGKDWIRKHYAEVQQNLEDYQRSSWDKVLGLLKLDENEPITAESMIENLKLFNMQFKETCRVQSTWFVLYEKLREEIRNSLEKIVWPAYGNFIGRLQTILGSQADEYIEYSMDDIDALLNDLFCGPLTKNRWLEEKVRLHKLVPNYNTRCSLSSSSQT